VDQEGFLHITDRKKDLIVTSGGKNIAPQKIENLAKSFSLITQLVVYGDRRNYLTALVTIDHEQVRVFAAESRITYYDYSDLINHPKIKTFVQKSIDQINQQLASFETIKKFTILPNDFTIESGELTPSLKIKRNVISKKFQTQLNAMYDN
jgi:long-chain acyl-CoA synthetase